MGRLTERITENIIELSSEANPIQYNGIPQRVHVKHPFWNVFDRLAEYEDLEEQVLKSTGTDLANMVGEFMHYYNLKKENRLLELPCKVGDTVWCIEECEDYEDYEDRFEISGYVFMSMCGEYCFVSAHFIHCNDIEEQLEDMVEECENWGSVDVGIFHKNKVFLTKEEAEKALAEITEFQKNSEKEVKTEAILAEMEKKDE